MFTFKNPNTPIIADGTQVQHDGLTFTIICSQYHYNIYLCDPLDEWAGGIVGKVPKAGYGGNYDWSAGVKEVEETIHKEANSHNEIYVAKLRRERGA